MARNGRQKFEASRHETKSPLRKLVRKRLTANHAGMARGCASAGIETTLPRKKQQVTRRDLLRAGATVVGLTAIPLSGIDKLTTDIG